MAMSAIECSIFDQPRPFSSSFVDVESTGSSQHSFLTFLAAVQKLSLEILPITWQSLRELIGAGGTSEINQAMITLESSLAFKRIADSQKTKETEDTIFRAWTSEITVLCQPSIRHHPNLLELQGVCWDVPAEHRALIDDGTAAVPPRSPLDKIWPVLVFEKSRYGDLYHFAQAPEGRALNIGQRLKLCAEITAAVLHMHSCQILHGDIKPENCLIFKDDAGEFTARVADFGYSTWYLHDDDLVALPKSVPWYAPEHDYTGAYPAQGRKMDTFSLGLLSLWLLFEKHVSGVEPLPNQTQSIIGSVIDGDQRGLRLFESLKFLDKLIPFATSLLSAESQLDLKTRCQLEIFFTKSLVLDPETRTENMELLLELLAPESTSPLSLGIPVPEDIDTQQDLNIAPALAISCYQSDFRVRSYIVECLRSEFSASGKSHLAFQLAFCCQIGFGIPRSVESSHEFLQASGKPQIDIGEEVFKIKYMAFDDDMVLLLPSSGKVYKDLQTGGQLEMIDYNDYYVKYHLLDDAIRVTRRDLSAIEYHCGPSHFLTQYIKLSLGELLTGRQQWDEVEDLFLQVLEEQKIYFGEDHPRTLATTGRLVAVYEDQLRWAEAEELLMGLVEARTRVLGSDHQSTLTAQTDLSTIYLNQERWKEAEILCAQILKSQKRIFGIEHPRTLITMYNMCACLREQERLDEFDALLSTCLGMSKTVLGERHERTLYCMSEFAMVLLRQRQLIESEELAIKAVETLQVMVGQEHPTTLNGTYNLMRVYNARELYEEAERLGLYLVEAQTRLLGAESPRTLNSMNELAVTYRGQRRFEECEGMLRFLWATRERLLGLDSLLTLNHKSNVATVLNHQGRHLEALPLHIEVLRDIRRKFGSNHLETLSAIEGLALTYQHLRQWGDLEKIAQDSISTQMTLERSPRGFSTIKRMQDLAKALFFQQKLDEAEEAAEQVLSTCQDILGATHEQTLRAMGRLAMIRFSKADFEGAIVTMEDTLELEKQITGPESADATATSHTLAQWQGIAQMWPHQQQVAAALYRTHLQKNPDEL